MSKGKNDWGKGTKINELVEAAECIAHNNKGWNGKQLYDIDSYFSGWLRPIIKKRLAIDKTLTMSIDSGIMPVITLYQPWATWIMRDWKLIETRTHDRFKKLNGKRILIHGGKRTDDSWAVLNNPYLTREQIIYKPDEVVNGFILGSVLVEDFRILDENDSRKALIDCCSVLRYGLFLNKTLSFAEPIKEKGQMGIWYYDLDNKRKVKIGKP